jgi:aarF domain-containing kinase
VHRATLRHPPPAAPGARSGRVAGDAWSPEVVAVKVRHPDVATIISRDFAILRVIAELTGALPGMAWLRLDESVRQFREPLFEQVDLTREACNLRLFNQNFASWRQVSFPKPIDHLVQPAVLVETFEEGASISKFLETDNAYVRRTIADLGCKALLKMMLNDNFVHADLHPGNILVRLEEGGGGSGLASLFGLRPRKPKPVLVLLDCGMTASLSDRNKHNLFKFFAVRAGARRAAIRVHTPRAFFACG